MIAPLKIAHMEPRLPIIQGGMAVRVSTGKLAAAVAKAGGIGTIAGTGLTLAELTQEIKKARALAGGVGYIGVNVLFAVKQFAELVKRAMQEKVDFIVSGAGFSRDMFDWSKDYGVPIIPIVSSSRLAKLAERLGAAAVVVEGEEAGGHLGTDRPLAEILPEVTSAVNIPIIAAGGLTDGGDIAETIKLGASGAQLATRFVLSEECEAHPNFKQMYLSATEDDLILIQSPVGLPGRALRNQLTDLISRGEARVQKCNQCLKQCSAKYCILDVLRRSVSGDTVNGLVFAGKNVFKIKKVLPVKEIMDNLARELGAALT
ncbi:MAG: NAD(P)H-dependent flavin oxidoreductase [Limnochordia bacterium]|jgi:nitronate monooxygenase